MSSRPTSSDEPERASVRDGFLVVASVVVLLAGGGDGTLNALADVLVRQQDAKTPPEMGIMPLGTANDLAHGLGIPCDDLEACMYKAAIGDA